MNQIKIIIFAISLLVSMMSVNAFAAGSLFSELDKNPDIQIVKVSNEVLRMAVQTGAASENMLEDIEWVNIYISHKRAGTEAMRKVSAAAVTADGMRLLLSNAEGGESVAMYGIPCEDTPGKYSQMVMISDDGDNMTIINMAGRLDLTAMQAIGNK